MKSDSGKSVKLKLRLKTWKNGKLVIDTTRGSIRRFRGIIRSQNADKYYLKVTYGKGWTKDGFEEIYNSGIYTNKKDLLNAFSIFTSREEITDFIENFLVRKE